MGNRRTKGLQQRLNKIEEDIFAGEDIDIKEFYMLKKELIDNKQDHHDLLELFLLLDSHKEKDSIIFFSKIFCNFGIANFCFVCPSKIGSLI